MSTLATIRQLVKDIGAFSNSLSDSEPKGSKDDKIWSVMNTEERDTPHETFNRWFDALFAEDCRDSNGHLHFVRRGKLGMGLVASYLSKINWTIGFPLDLVKLKLHCLVIELKVLQYIPDSIIHCIHKLLGNRMYLDLYAPSILLQSSRMQPTLQHPSSHSNAKLSKITALAKRNLKSLGHLSKQKITISLLHCHLNLTRMCPAPPIPRQLHKLSAPSLSTPSLPSPVTVMLKINQNNVCFFESANLKLIFNLLCHHLQPKNGPPWHPHRRPRESAQPRLWLTTWIWRTPIRIYVKRVWIV